MAMGRQCFEKIFNSLPKKGGGEGWRAAKSHKRDYLAAPNRLVRASLVRFDGMSE